jgi:hypothetical protein
MLKKVTLRSYGYLFKLSYYFWYINGFFSTTLEIARIGQTCGNNFRGYDQGCHADNFGRTDGQTDERSDDGHEGIRDLDAL